MQADATIQARIIQVTGGERPDDLMDSLNEREPEALLSSSIDFDPRISASLESVQELVDCSWELALRGGPLSPFWYEVYRLARAVKAEIEQHIFGGQP
jgi:hypothetical protein